MGVQDGWFVDRGAKLRGVGSGWVSPLDTARFVATMYSNDEEYQSQIITSPDGITWTAHDVPVGIKALRMACKGTNAWVAVTDRKSVV